MSLAYQEAQQVLRAAPRTWLVTGVAGFIGSNILETLLRLDQQVMGLDNFATGYESNLAEVKAVVGEGAWSRFRMFEGDIRDVAVCYEVMAGVDHVLHQAALGSVPRSLEDPISNNDVNVSGFVNILTAAKDARVSSFVYAGSSATYGDDPCLPKVEDRIGKPLSPYAVSKHVDEIYANLFKLAYGYKATGLRYFNVFGARQDPEGAYAAVIPKWIASMLLDEVVLINGDGQTSRDFCFVANVVQANILAALAGDEAAGEIYNIAVGAGTTLNELLQLLRIVLAENGFDYDRAPVYRDFRLGDVTHSLADVQKAKRLLGYQPTHTIGEGLREAANWYINRFRPSSAPGHKPISGIPESGKG